MPAMCLIPRTSFIDTRITANTHATASGSESNYEHFRSIPNTVTKYHHVHKILNNPNMAMHASTKAKFTAFPQEDAEAPGVAPGRKEAAPEEGADVYK